MQKSHRWIDFSCLACCWVTKNIFKCRYNTKQEIFKKWCPGNLQGATSSDKNLYCRILFDSFSFTFICAPVLRTPPRLTCQNLRKGVQSKSKREQLKRLGQSKILSNDVMQSGLTGNMFLKGILTSYRTCYTKCSWNLYTCRGNCKLKSSMCFQH